MLLVKEKKDMMERSLSTISSSNNNLHPLGSGGLVEGVLEEEEPIYEEIDNVLARLEAQGWTPPPLPPPPPHNNTIVEGSSGAVGDYDEPDGNTTTIGVYVEPQRGGVASSTGRQECISGFVRMIGGERAMRYIKTVLYILVIMFILKQLINIFPTSFPNTSNSQNPTINAAAALPYEISLLNQILTNVRNHTTQQQQQQQ